MKIKYKGDTYCVSKCAKDKFQRFVLKPVSIIITLVLVIIALGAFSLIWDGVFSLFGFTGDQFPVSMGALLWQLPLMGFMKILVIVIVLAVISVVVLAVATFVVNVNKYIDTWINTKYETRYKKECNLFEKCKD